MYEVEVKIIKKFETEREAKRWPGHVWDILYENELIYSDDTFQKSISDTEDKE